MIKNENETFYPGTRVMAFDYQIYIDDVRTPISMTVKPATVMCWFGERSCMGWTNGDLVDLQFDHRPEKISRSHFADGVEKIGE